MALHIEIEGVRYDTIIEKELTVSMETLANDFKFKVSANNRMALPPFRINDEVKIYIDEELRLTGFIDEITGYRSEDAHTVTYSGRDKTADLIDSMLDVMPDLRPKGAFTLKQLIEAVLAHIDLSIEVIDTIMLSAFDPKDFNEAEDHFTPEQGQNAYEFIKLYAEKRHVLLSSNGEGNIEIIKNEPSSAVFARIEDGGGPETEEFTLDYRGRYRRHVMRGQQDTRAGNLAGLINNENLESQVGRALDDNVRSGRQYVETRHQGYSNQQLQDISLWHRLISESQSVRYNCTVNGHRNNLGDIWKENTNVLILSNFLAIRDEMLLVGATFIDSESQGTMTRLTFADKFAYRFTEPHTDVAEPSGGSVLGNLIKRQQAEDAVQ